MKQVTYTTSRFGVIESVVVATDGTDTVANTTRIVDKESTRSGETETYWQFKLVIMSGEGQAHTVKRSFDSEDKAEAEHKMWNDLIDSAKEEGADRRPTLEADIELEYTQGAFKPEGADDAIIFGAWRLRTVIAVASEAVRVPASMLG